MTRTEFKAFYEKTYRSLWGYLYRLCSDAEITNDLVQEAYLKFLQNPSRSDHEAQMKTYLYTIATRLNIDRWKRTKRHRKWQLINTGEDHKSDGLAEKVGLETDLSRMFQNLKPQERALLWMAYVEEQPHREIARILDVKEKSVRVLLFRARKKLANLLKREGFGKEVIS